MSGSTSTTLDDAVPASQPAKASEPDVVQGANFDEALSGDMVEVTIFPGSDDIGKLPVFLGLNSYAYNAPRGKPVIIPKEVFDSCIVNARVDILSARQGGGIDSTTAQRFQYQVHREIPAPKKPRRERAAA